ncbi:unnamed protein product [Callosobruchus maculatus]|uniref:Uncharacterized protein n=1 Tax=Callosobruchus maculatus TaxID=64391 RepID=A0A653DSF7_CALMS|nr:unnamed protein product [Callosobruchus maculatus]
MTEIGHYNLQPFHLKQIESKGRETEILQLTAQNLVKPRTATYTTRAKKIEAENWEKSHLAYGDMNRILTAPQKQRKAPIYDPIARSIAEYISNNVPERLHNLPWLRS